MTGSGRGGVVLPSSGSDEDDSCLSLEFTTNLETIPDAPVHRPSTVLKVVQTSTGFGTVFVVVDSEDRAVGTIVEHLALLLRCMSQGHEYVAEVQSVTSGVHTVRVRALAGRNS